MVNVGGIKLTSEIALGYMKVSCVYYDLKGHVILHDRLVLSYPVSYSIGVIYISALIIKLIYQHKLFNSLYFFMCCGSVTF